MKQFLLSTTLVLAFHLVQPCYAQKPGLPYNRFTGEITQTNVVQTGQPREKTYYAIKAWISRTYPNYREIIRTEDLSAGKIVYEDSEPVAATSFKSFSYQVTIDIKDGSFSCKIDHVKTLSSGSATYASADMDFSTMGMYGKDIDDLDREISIAKNKKELDKLCQDKRVIKSFLRDFDKSHNTMDLQFTMIQNGLRRAVMTGGSLAAK